jgi:hypothetical protein
MTSLETFSLNRASPRYVSRDAVALSLTSCPYTYTRSWLSSAQAKALMPGPPRMMRDTCKRAERTRGIPRGGVRKMIECLAIRTAVVNMMRRTPGFSTVAMRADMLSPYHESLR